MSKQKKAENEETFTTYILHIILKNQLVWCNIHTQEWFRFDSTLA